MSETLRGALREALGLIRILHGEPGWEEYQSSPEMKRIAAALRAQKPSEPVGGRAETGPVRFGDDWAGVFIRGDEAFSRALQMDAVAEHYEGLADGDFSGKGMLAINIQGFADLLRSCTEPCEARAIHLAAEEDE